MSTLTFILILIFLGGVLTLENMNPSNSQKQFAEIILDRVEVVFEAPETMKWDVKIKKVNKTRSLIGVITLHINLGDDYKLELKVLKKQGGEYRYLPYGVPASPFCNLITADSLFYPDFANVTEFPVDIANNCPIPPGNYTIFGYTVNLDKFPVIVAQSGEYAAEVIFYEFEKLISTYRIYSYFNKV